ncbi:MAG: YeaH/YhbH family protein [Gammaproteobacteria bacterium]|nr:YeaH/YhbH family protein [Gammaproteobacteria bacterium]
MAAQIIDRRPNGRHKSAVNRQRFLRRYRKHIKDAVSDAVNKRSITDTDRGDSISIPKKDISEPVFRHGAGGRQYRVLPGNKEFIQGDKINRPPSGGGGGGGDASNTGEGMDDFVFEISRQEFLDFMFEDLELPNLIKTQLKNTENFKYIKGGYTNEGIPARLNIVQSVRSAHSRRIALRGATKRRIRSVTEQLDALGDKPENEDEARDLRVKLERLERRLNHIPFLDDFDLKYNNLIQQPAPTNNAVMFCLMDVSGSMTQDIKDLAKRFFILLHLFLRQNYKRTDVVFIRHHTVAAEVDEEEFFYSRETGGTVVSSALKLMLEVVRDRYPSEDWNIYAAQASDGENWEDDSSIARDVLANSILPLVQYYAYIEITKNEPQRLWRSYEELLEKHGDYFSMKKVTDAGDIYPVFRELFEKKPA